MLKKFEFPCFSDCIRAYNAIVTWFVVDAVAFAGAASLVYNGLDNASQSSK